MPLYSSFLHTFTVRRLFSSPLYRVVPGRPSTPHLQRPSCRSPTCQRVVLDTVCARKICETKNAPHPTPGPMMWCSLVPGHAAVLQLRMASNWPSSCSVSRLLTTDRPDRCLFEDEILWSRACQDPPFLWGQQLKLGMGAAPSFRIICLLRSAMHVHTVQGIRYHPRLASLLPSSPAKHPSLQRHA